MIVRSLQPQHRMDSQGSVALYLVMIMSILLMTTTVVASRLAISELSQASEVDLSDAAYYAAEAGVEEASRRLDANTSVELELAEIFPEQYTNGANGGSQHGDRMQLTDSDGGSNLGGSLGIAADPESDHADIFGRLSWRQRRVYEEPLAPLGTQVKDESIQLDTTELRREINGTIYGNDGTDSDGSSIHAAFGGIEYCWTPKGPGNVTVLPDLELTVLSYPSNNAGAIETEKYVFSEVSNVQSGRFINISVAGTNPTEQDLYANCIDITTTDTSRRYIFRVRPLFAGASDSNPNAYQVSYRTKLIDTRLNSHQPGSTQPPLYIPGSTVLIDVVGQSGDIRRRIVARKERNGRILGIFDYVLYSGDPVLPVCKVGVQQVDEPSAPGTGYTLGNCLVAGNVDQGQEPTLPDLPQDDPPEPDEEIYEAETFNVNSGAVVVNNGSASGGQAQRMNPSHSWVGMYLTPQDNYSSIEVRARRCSTSGSPRMRININGGSNYVGTTHIVSSTSYNTYTFNVSGSSQFNLYYVVNYSGYGCLEVDYLEFVR
ncbi:MAG: hypothetical protein WD467_01600 [Candidatus Saccharimonadales bacterium]